MRMFPSFTLIFLLFYTFSSLPLLRYITLHYSFSGSSLQNTSRMIIDLHACTGLGDIDGNLLR